MEQLKDSTDLRAWCAQHTDVAFVPTMGNLHAGHVALIQLAQQHAPQVLVSIFVNPLQFGPQEDFSLYPRTLEADLALLQRMGVNAVFTPDVSVLYPVTQTYFVQLPKLADELCGKYRLGHFHGVATVVLKLFHLVQPTLAFFGKKDYQQLMLIRCMAQDFLMPIKVVAGDTIRESDGLALSSRNQYLTVSERVQAPQLYAQLQSVAQYLKAGARDFAQLEQMAQHVLMQQGWQVDYVSIRDLNLAVPTQHSLQFVVLGAAKLGQTRLIDNVEVL